MAFQLSPSVAVQETDLSNIIPAVSTSTGATVGQFGWGPVDRITLIDNEEKLAQTFGKPNDTNFKDFFTTAAFLAYASGLKVVRVVEGTALNASATEAIPSVGQLIKNEDAYSAISFTVDVDLFIAKYPGVLGNSLGVAYANTAGFNDVDSAGETLWPWADLFTEAPAANEYHVVVYDADGEVTGTADTVLEIFPFVSTTPGSLAFDGTSSYFKTKINNESQWIWIGNEALLTGDGHDGINLDGGTDGAAVTDGDRNSGFALFVNDEAVDVSLVFQGAGSRIVGKWIIDNVAEVRRDCLALVSVEQDDVVSVFDDTIALSNILATRTSYGSSSYAVMDSAYKYTYDRYNDTYRWIPLNGDIAGLIAKTDNDFDAWFSPAGYNRGRIKNAIRLSTDQTRSFRDELYKKGVNPCNVFSVEGAVLFGDKTLLTRPSAFDRINVRRLFTTLEKAISTAAKYLLFDQNDEYTRTLFLNMVEPFLRDIQGRRGITDFRVICDTTNNTPEVIDRQEFVASIYIKPTKSINFITLNFVAVRTGVAFEEVVISGTPDNPGTSQPITL